MADETRSATRETAADRAARDAILSSVLEPMIGSGSMLSSAITSRRVTAGGRPAQYALDLVVGDPPFARDSRPEIVGQGSTRPALDKQALSLHREWTQLNRMIEELRRQLRALERRLGRQEGKTAQAYIILDSTLAAIVTADSPDRLVAVQLRAREVLHQRYLAQYPGSSLAAFEDYLDGADHRRQWDRAWATLWTRVRATGSVLLELSPRARIKFCAELIDRLWENQGGICPLCQEELYRQNLDVDHIVPISLAGGNEDENLQLAHPRCNRSKGNRRINYEHVIDYFEKMLREMPDDEAAQYVGTHRETRARPPV